MSRQIVCEEYFSFKKKQVPSDSHPRPLQSQEYSIPTDQVCRSAEMALIQEVTLDYFSTALFTSLFNHLREHKKQLFKVQ